MFLTLWQQLGEWIGRNQTQVGESRGNLCVETQGRSLPDELLDISHSNLLSLPVPPQS